MQTQNENASEEYRTPSESRIGTLNERSLHAALKAMLLRENDEEEVKFKGYFIDIKRGDILIEIQTGSFSQIHQKLEALINEHPIYLYYPLPLRRWVRREDPQGQLIRRRRSPKKGKFIEIFNELIYLKQLLLHPNFELHVLMVEEETVWVDDGKGSWRNQFWSKADRQLIEVEEEIIFEKAVDYLQLLPRTLPEPFTNQELSKHANCTARIAGKCTYTLYQLNLLERVGKQGKAYLYQRTSDPSTFSI